MKAIGVFPKERAVRVVDHPEPPLESPHEVRVRILNVGICGTDKEICRFEYGDPPPGSDYLILGHESLGEVVETGRDVSTLKKGDLVVLMVRRPCSRPDCQACRAGRQDFCYTGEFTERGIKARHGFMTETVVDEEQYVVPVPRELRDIAILTEPLTIAEKAFIQVLEIQQRLPWLSPAAGSDPPLSRRRGLVLGAGPVGLLGAMKLLAAGCATAVYSREPAGSTNAQLVAGLGARYVSSADVQPAQLDEVLGQIDLVYEATGASTLSFQVLAELGANGVFVFTGVPGRKYPVEVETGTIMKRMVLENQIVMGTVNAGRDAFEAAVRDLAIFRARFPEALTQMITEHHPLEQFPQLDLDHLSGIKHVIDVGSEPRP